MMGRNSVALVVLSLSLLLLSLSPAPTRAQDSRGPNLVRDGSFEAGYQFCEGMQRITSPVHSGTWAVSGTGRCRFDFNVVQGERYLLEAYRYGTSGYVASREGGWWDVNSRGSHDLVCGTVPDQWNRCFFEFVAPITGQWSIRIQEGGIFDDVYAGVIPFPPDIPYSLVRDGSFEAGYQFCEGMQRITSPVHSGTWAVSGTGRCRFDFNVVQGERYLLEAYRYGTSGYVASREGGWWDVNSRGSHDLVCGTVPDQWNRCYVELVAPITGQWSLRLQEGGVFDDVLVARISDLPPPTPTPMPTTRPVPTPTPFVPSGGSGVDAGKPCYIAMQIAAERIARGLDYCWGSNDPDKPVFGETLCPTNYGLDCSGLGVWAYRQAGVNMPDDTAKGMYNRYPRISGSLSGAGLAVGDAVVIGRTGPGDIYHVAWYVGGGMFADCYNTAVGCVVHRIDNIPAYVNAGFVGYFRTSAGLGLPQCVTSDLVEGVPPGGVGGGGGGGGSPGGGGFWDRVLPGWSEMMNPPTSQPAGYSQLEAESSMLPAELSQPGDTWSASLTGSLYDFGCPINIDRWGMRVKLCLRYRYISRLSVLGVDIPLEPMMYGMLALTLVYIVKRR